MINHNYLENIRLLKFGVKDKCFHLINCKFYYACAHKGGLKFCKYDQIM